MSKNREEVITNGRAVFYTVLWPSFRKAALDLGWTLALHGSMASDMDIIAMPWVDDAKPVDELIKAMSACVGNTVWTNSHFEPPKKQPHGRLTYTLSIYSDLYIDLSVMPLKEDPHEVSRVKCDLCTYTWIAARPEGLTKLECPHCHNMVSFENIQTPPDTTRE